MAYLSSYGISFQKWRGTGRCSTNNCKKELKKERIKRNSRKTSRNNLRAKWAGQVTFNTAVVLWNCYNSPAHGFFRFGAWDRSLMLAQSKYKRFGHNFCSRMLNFGHRSLWNYIYALKYFQISPEQWKPQRRQQEWATQRNGYGRITWLHSHELSDIAKLQCSNRFVQNT